MAQALVRFLENQYISYDGIEHPFVEGVIMLPGHGNVVGLGQALAQEAHRMQVWQGKNEQGMAHTAVAFAKQCKRKKIIAVTSSVGPGAANMVTAAATAPANNIPVLILPGDVYACRQPDPVLQQVEQTYDLSLSTNDAFRPVCRYWDRVVRPEQLMSAMLSAMRVLTDPANTGAVCVAMPQDVEGESYDFPTYFFEKRVHRITRPVAVEEELEDIAAQEIRANGYDYAVSVRLEDTAFPTREYEGFTLPAGRYLALRAVIGAGEGRNWWCVVFPPLCAAASAEVPAAALAAGMSPSQVGLITEENHGYVLKSKLVEFWQQLEQEFT